MLKFHLQLAIFLFLLILAGCGERERTTYLGGWEETNVSFTPLIQQARFPEEYYQSILGYKFSGSMYSEDQRHAISWIRNPENLSMVFQTIKAVGMEKIVSRENYRRKIDLSEDWQGRTLDGIVKDFLASDTASTGADPYYNEFWLRRKAEGNHALVYTILTEVDAFYNDGNVAEPGPVNDTLQNLLAYNFQLLHPSDPITSAQAYDYFAYLKEIGLEHSAYELAWFWNSYPPTEEWTINADSLVQSLQPDTLSEKEWAHTNINYTGWIDYQSIYGGP
ncbi:MAG: hypothetical protein AAF206_10595 [Bacteroidota bacterium]